MKQDSKKQEILKIAFDYFLNKGYEATTLRMICKKANVEAPSVYYYFGSKKGLFFAVIDYILEQYQVIKEKVNDNLVFLERNPENVLEQIAIKAVFYSIKHEKETKFYMRYTMFPPSELKRDINSYMKQTYEQKELLYKQALKYFLLKHKLKIELEDAFMKYEKLINSLTFHVVFSNWRPEEDEVKVIVQTFLLIQFQK